MCLRGTAMDDSATDALFCFPSLFVHQATLFLVLDVGGDPSCVPCRDDKISCPLMEEFVLFLYCDLVDIAGDALILLINLYDDESTPLLISDKFLEKLI